MISDLGRLLMLVGVILGAAGLLLTLAGKIPWLGKLPGDIYYKSDNVTVYFPIVTCVILSVVLSVIVYFLRR